MMDGRNRGRSLLAGAAVLVGALYWYSSLVHWFDPERALDAVLPVGELPVAAFFGLLAAVAPVWALCDRYGVERLVVWVPVFAFLTAALASGWVLLLAGTSDRQEVALGPVSAFLAVMTVFGIRRPPAPPVAAPATAAVFSREETPLVFHDDEEVQEEVRRIVRSVAESVADTLERRLEYYYGSDWLGEVNERRKDQGHTQGWSMADHRFCLALLGYDDATEDWAERWVRAAARKLVRLGNKAAHNEPMGDLDLAEANEAAQKVLSTSLPL